MFYRVPLFSVKSIFCIKFMALRLLILLIIQQKSALLMLKIAMQLRFIDINNKSCHAFADVWLKFKSFI